jgi:hypothetical protein
MVFPGFWFLGDEGGWEFPDDLVVLDFGDTSEFIEAECGDGYLSR